MKKSVVLCFALMCVALRPYAQTLTDSALQFNVQALHYYDAATQKSAQMLAANPGDTTEGGEINEFARMSKRMEQFFCTNAPAGADARLPAAEVLTSVITSPDQFCIGSGGNWQCLGPYIDNYGGTENAGKVFGVWVSPTDTNFILAANFGGLWKSRNGGHSWHNISDGISVGYTGNKIPGCMGMIDLAVDPLNPAVIYGYLADFTGICLGAAYTYDSGDHWQFDTSLNRITGFNYYFGTPAEKIRFMPGTEKLFIYTDRQSTIKSKVLMKEHPTAAWQDITPSLGIDSLITDMEFCIADPKKVVFSTSALDDTAHLWTYDTSSASWTDLKLYMTVPGEALNGIDYFSMSATDSVFMLMKMNSTQYVATTPLSSAHLNLLAATAGYQYFIVSPNHTNVMYGTLHDGANNFLQSVDRGNTFHATQGITHADARFISLFQPATVAGGINDDVLFAGTDGGVVKKRFNRVNFESITGDSMCIGQLFGVSNIEGNDDLVTGGAQDNGEFVYNKNRTRQWSQDAYGDGMIPAFMRNGVTKALTEVNFPGLFEVNFNRAAGTEAFNTTSNPDDACNAVYWSGCNSILRPWWVDQNNTVYVGYRTVWKATLPGLDWQDAFAPGGDPLITANEPRVCAIALAEPNNDTMYVAFRGQADSTPTGPGNEQGKLFLTKQASSTSPGPAWQNITPGYAQYWPINAMQVDPQQPGRLWVGYSSLDFGNFTENAANRQHRVQYSPNYGQSWYDVSSGLPPLPINDIKYRHGSKDDLYAATAIGVYRCDFSTFDSTLPNNNITWTCFNNGMPLCDVTQMEFNYCANKLRVSTFGRGFWESSLDDINPLPDPTKTIITTNTIWNTNMNLVNSVTVMPGATLTISNDTVHMPKNGAIIVAPGAHLIVSHSMLTNDCDQCFWRGIAAAGSTAATQTTANQAWVTITGGSTIQHAVTAVADYNFITDTAAATTAGGIIQAFGSSFTDNQNAVTLRNYQHTTATGAYVPDLSYFHECTFLLDNKYKGDALSLPMIAHVSMAGVHGISFTGCQFLNRDTSAYSVQKGEGIRSIDASFNVTPYCSTPLCYTPLRSRFCGFTNGISVQGTVSLDLTTSIDQADFDTVGVGIYVSADNSVSATNCDFTVGHATAVNDVAQLCGGQNIGIYHQNSELFRVEGNKFQGIASTAPYWVNYGAVFINDAFYGGTTVSFPNKVYRNTFAGLTYGVTAIGDNTSAALPSGGLEIACNHFYSNTSDIFTAGDGGPYVQGISSWQGTATLPAGNTFSGSSYNINNNAGSIRYYYNTADATQHPSYPATTAVTLIGTTAVNSCPSGVATSGGGGLGLGGPHMDVHRSAFMSTRDTLQDSLALYNHLIDYGNTDSLIAIIDTSADTVALYNLLQKAAPWLSEAALRETGDDGMFPYASMMKILQQNPDVLRDDDFLYYMQGDYGFSDNDISILQSASVKNTARTSLESRIQTCSMTLGDEANIIMMAVKSPIDTNVSPQDTTGAGICTDSSSVYFTLDSNSYYYTLDSTDTWLQRIGGDWTYYARIGYWNGRGQYTTANALEQSLPNLLSQQYYEDQLDTFSTAWAYLYPAEQAYTGAGVCPLSALPPLRTYTGVPPLTDNNALQVINTISGGTRNPIPPTPDPCSFVRNTLHRRSVPPRSGPGSVAAASSVTVFPNPASGTVTFTCNVPAASSLNIVITNIMGERVAIIPTATGQGKTLWDTRSQPAGVYLYQVTAPGSLIAQGKLVIIK
jgi:hypothetical protein